MADQNCHSDCTYDGMECSTCCTLKYGNINKGVYRCLIKINEAAIGKNQEIVGLKVLIFRLHYTTIYFADIKFPN